MTNGRRDDDLFTQLGNLGWQLTGGCFGLALVAAAVVALVGVLIYLISVHLVLGLAYVVLLVALLYRRIASKQEAAAARQRVAAASGSPPEKPLTRPVLQYGSAAASVQEAAPFRPPDEVCDRCGSSAWHQSSLISPRFSGIGARFACASCERVRNFEIVDGRWVSTFSRGWTWMAARASQEDEGDLDDEDEGDLDDEDEEDDMPKPPPVPMRSDVSLAAVAWPWRKWEGAKKERPNPTKEALLRRSLDMVRGKKGNEEAVREIVEKSIEAGLFHLAMEAIEGFGPDAAFDMYVSIKNLFEDAGTWPLLDGAFVELCERRVLDGKTARSGIGWGDHYTDQRSSALGVLGRYRLITGEPSMAVGLWAAGEDVVDVDEAIAETCDLIAQHAGSHLDYAISLTDLIRTETIRAKTLASLSEYA